MAKTKARTISARPTKRHPVGVRAENDNNIVVVVKITHPVVDGIDLVYSYKSSTERFLSTVAQLHCSSTRLCWRWSQCRYHGVGCGGEFRALLLAILLVACSPKDETKSPGLEEAVSTAVDVYLYGYPLMTFDIARMQQTNVAVPDAEHAPMGQMIRMRTYPAVDNHCCAAPNADTLYTEAWLDVSKEPSVLSIPDMGNRYYIIPMLDGYSEVMSVASPATTGYKAQTYAITGPGWTGTLPPNVTQVKSATGMVWVLGRIYCTGTPDDYKAVHALQDKFTVVPLSSHGKPYTPPVAQVDPNFDMKTAVRKQVDGLDVNAYFTRLAQLMKTNPPTARRCIRWSRGWRRSDSFRDRTTIPANSAA